MQFWYAAAYMAFALFMSAEGAATPLKDLGAPGFTCPAEVMKKSAKVPSSVHSLRFADIDIIAAMGDSLTAANGAGARPHDIVAILLQWRGLSFPAGGDKSLDEHVTIPNILKKFNKDLFGYSHGTGSANVWPTAKLNAGVPGAHSIDMKEQAHDLVRRMKAHPEIDFNNHWKMVNIFIGGNDICSYCRHPDHEDPVTFGNNIRDGIQVLKDNMPRTVVVLMGMLDMILLRKVDKKNPYCEFFHHIECSCEQNMNLTDIQLSETCHKYMASEQILQDSGMFDTSDDFTVVIQPFWEGLTMPPINPDGTADLTFFCPDCFHFSQYGHALVAKNFWNNMVEPVGKKTRAGELNDPTFPLKCPDPSCPFIRTTKNSVDCSKYITPAA